MTHRPHVHVVKLAPAEPGTSPNRYVPRLTADLRFYWTPDTPYQDVVDFAQLAADDLVRKVHRSLALDQLADFSNKHGLVDDPKDGS